MNCFDTRKANTTTTTTTNNGYTIAEILRRLDKMQRDAVLSAGADACENCMLTAMYNTKPISLYTNCRQITAPLGLDGDETNIFRVEAVRDDDTVVLRLLEDNDGDITCTAYTLIVRIECICCIQCFDPINCETTCYPVV